MWLIEFEISPWKPDYASRGILDDIKGGAHPIGIDTIQTRFLLSCFQKYFHANPIILRASDASNQAFTA